MQDKKNEGIIPGWEKCKADALKFVAEAGGEVVKIFNLTEGTPITVIHSKFKEPQTDGFEVFVGGKLLCAAVDWTSATVIGSALGYTGLSLIKGDGDKSDSEKERAW